MVSYQHLLLKIHGYSNQQEGNGHGKAQEMETETKLIKK